MAYDFGLGKKSYIDKLAEGGDTQAILQKETQSATNEYEKVSKEELDRRIQTQKANDPNRYQKLRQSDQFILQELIKREPSWVKDLPFDYSINEIDLFLVETKRQGSVDVLFPPRYSTILTIDQDNEQFVDLDIVYPIANNKLFKYVDDKYPYTIKKIREDLFPEIPPSPVKPKNPFLAALKKKKNTSPKKKSPSPQSRPMSPKSPKSPKTPKSSPKSKKSSKASPKTKETRNTKTPTTGCAQFREDLERCKQEGCVAFEGKRGKVCRSKPTKKAKSPGSKLSKSPKKPSPKSPKFSPKKLNMSSPPKKTKSPLKLKMFADKTIPIANFVMPIQKAPEGMAVSKAIPVAGTYTLKPNLITGSGRR